MTDSPTPPERPPLLPLPISPAHLQAIGGIVAMWSHVEMAMDIAIMNIYDMSPDSGLVVLSHTGANSKISLLKLLIANHPRIHKTKRAPFKKAIEKLEKLYKERNEVAHALWIGAEDGTFARRMSINARGGKLKVWNDEIHISRLITLIDMLQKAYLHFLKLLVDAGFQGQPVPEAS